MLASKDADGVLFFRKYNMASIEVGENAHVVGRIPKIWRQSIAVAIAAPLIAGTGAVVRNAIEEKPLDSGLEEFINPSVSLLGLEVGYVVLALVGLRLMLPIKFRVDDHEIRSTKIVPTPRVVRDRV